MKVMKNFNKKRKGKIKIMKTAIIARMKIWAKLIYKNKFEC